MSRHSGRENIAQLLLQRERGILRGRNVSVGQTTSECSRALGSWTEQDFMQHCSATYVDFKPVPRSTIAAAFSPNGKLLASTHGDHTVKIINCFTGACVKVLEGHTRTPWVVRFHPIDSDLFASGSLDHRVVVWRISTGEKVFNHDFGKPIASIAFHPSGKALVVASGHKVYFWDYSKPASSTRPHQNPSYILRTKRSLRALHFHPLGLPLVLTAEVVDNKKGGAGLVDGDGNATAAAATGQALGLPVGVGQATAAQPSQTAEAGNMSLLGHSLSDVARRVLDMAGIRLSGPLQAVARALMQAPRPAFASSGGSSSAEPQVADHLRQDLERLGFTDATGRQLQSADVRTREATAAGSRIREAAVAGGPAAGGLPGAVLPANLAAAAATQGQMAAVAAAAAAAMSAMERLDSGGGASSSSSSTAPSSQIAAAQIVDVAMCDPWGMQRIRSAVGVQTHAFPLEPQPLGSAYDLAWGWEAAASGEATRPPPLRQNAMLESQLTPLAVVSEQPCVVNLNVWTFNHRRPTSMLDKPRISVPRAVLCSEMGAQFSPCGRYLAVCVAVDELSEAAQSWLKGHIASCKQRMRQAENVREVALSRFRGKAVPSSSSLISPALPPSSSKAALAAAAAAGSSSHDAEHSADHISCVDTNDGFMVPVSQAWEVFPNEVQWLEFSTGTLSERVDQAVLQAREAAGLNKPLYELRIYSLEGGTFGQIIKARLIRAAHCLTSLQFSPTSEHLLVAYGRRFISLCNLIAEGRSLVPAHTVLEMYSLKDLQMVRALPSLDDEVNVAAFHPVPGAGIVYGTKEGKLRSLRYDRRLPRRPTIAIATGDGRMDEELAAAERDDGPGGSTSGEEDVEMHG